ncbi:MAG: rhomboid family intramembrane serine protease, partial [Acidobacteria bacterium]|nr:rhomboid family intramembrane serine protease [Acidobacteriota bacterium]
MSEGQTRDASAYAGRPSMCRQCGALVGAGESDCTMCGAPSTAGMPREDAAAARRSSLHDHETMRFVRSIVSRPATFTFVFLVTNIFLYLLMELSGGATGDLLLAYGAKLNYLIDHEGQWWRFVTPIFLHVRMPGLGPLHLLANMYGLFMLGPYVEKLYGSAKFVVFWVASGVVGVVASYLTVQPALAASSSVGRFLFKGYDAPSAGASGALFGLVGVLFVFGIKYRRELPEGFKRAFGTGMIPTILINLFIGFTIPFIDNAAHLGGFFAGALLALFVGYERPGQSARVAFFWHALQFASLALVVAGFGQVARHIGNFRPNFSNPRETLSQLGASPVN